MAYVKTVRVVYTKGIDAVDPFMLAGIVKPVLNRNDRYVFEQEYPTITSYAALVALCERFVELDPTKAVGTEPEYGAKHEVYNDEPVPWRKLLWDTAVYLLTKTTVPETWDIKIGDHDYRGPNLYLCHRTANGVTSPSAEVEQASRHGIGKMVKIRCYPGLAMNVALEKAMPEKIAAKLVEHGEKTLSSLKARTERETEQKTKQVKAKRLVNLIESMCGVPRYYEGSSELELSTSGAALRVTPNEYGYTTVTLSMSVHTEGQVEKIRPLVDLVMALKKANDMVKKEAK